MNPLYEKRGVFAGRKAQITVFMIVGIILLFSSALLFYIRGQIVEGIGDEFIPTIEEVPLEAQPIKVYVENCLEQVATEAIRKASAHGGYIDPTDNSYGRVFSIGIEPTESDALMMVESSNSIIPYWWHMDSPNDCIRDCQFSNQRPALYKTETGELSIEGQIDKYIKKRLPACIDGFKSFEDQGFQVEVLGEIEPDFKVAERESIILLTYPIRVSRAGNVIDVNQFFAKVDVDFKRIYNMASDLINSELDIQFLEKHTMNLIAMYSKPVSIERLPPLGHSSFFDYSTYLIWTRAETQQRLESYVLPPGIMMFQVVGTANSHRNVIIDLEEQKYDRVSTGILDKTMVMLNNTDLSTPIEVRFAYLDWWPIYLNINDAEVLKPSEFSPIIAAPLMDLLGMKQYVFAYDISYPVLITVTDPLAFNGRGLKFNFAIEANIRDNEPMNSSFVGFSPAPAPSFFCDINQRNSGLVRIEVEDIVTGDPVEHARVDFIAGDELCFVGFAELDENNVSVLETNFPVGAGELRIMKDDYVPLKEPMLTSLNRSFNRTARVAPFIFINATVEPIPLEYIGKGKYAKPLGPTQASLLPYQKVMMTFDRIDDDGFGEYSTYLMYNNTEGPSEMMMVPGKYEVEGYLMRYKEHVIDAYSTMIEVPFSDDIPVEFNESRFMPWTEGGVVFNNVTGYLEVTYDDLLNSKFVRFKVLRFPLPSSHSNEVKPGPDLGQMGEHELYSSIYRQDIEPEWVK